jgi:hypothetical protein
MARTTPARRPNLIGALLTGFAMLLAIAPQLAAAQVDDGADTSAADTARVGKVELRVEATGAVTTASLLSTWEEPLLDLQTELDTILLGAGPSEPILIRFAGELPEGDGWTPVGTVAAVDAEATESVVRLDGFLDLSSTDQENTFRSLVARRWLLGVSDGAMPAPLVDGFASYIERPVLARQARQASLAQQAYLNDGLPSWDALIADPGATVDLDPDAAQAARVAAASFLIERYGANMVGDLAAGFRDDPEATPAAVVSELTGQPADRLDAAWEDYIAVWFAGGWRSNAFAALDLAPAQDLFDRGAYEAAVDRANQTLQVTSALDDRIGSSEAEMLVAQGSVGMQAEALMRDAQQALEDHDYGRALTLIDRAVDQYALLPEDHRPASLIDTWRGMALDGIAAVERLDRATREFDDWFSMRAARQDAVEAGSTFASLGDTERVALAGRLVDDLDERFLTLVLALGAALAALVGWLLVWSWHRSPGRIRWPGLADLAREEARS